MTDMTITAEDVDSFRDKLDAWATTLTDNEQAILAMVAVRAFPEMARATQDEVQGYGGGTFEVEDYSFDIEQVLNIGSQSSGAGAGKVTFNPFQITRKTDKASPLLFAACSSFVGVPIHKG
jgi:hypothetical protein